MADVFVSYASEDRERVAPLAEALVEHGWSVWWDRQIPPGQTFDEVIERELNAASAVLCVWTADGVASRWVRTEAAEGLARNMLVPVLFEDVQIPLAFRRIQAADLIDWQPGTDHRGFDELVAALEVLVASGAAAEAQPLPPQPPDPLERALVGARSRAAAGDWTGVIAVINSLDAETAARAAEVPEIGELLTTARHKRDAAELYDEAEVLFAGREWRAALAKLGRVLELDPDAESAADLMRRAQQHLEAERTARRAHLHDRASEALQAREWPVAIARFEELLQAAPDDEVAAAGLSQARANAKSEERYRELQRRFVEREWSAVVAGARELAEANPDFGDPADLLARAEARAESAERSLAAAEVVDVGSPEEQQVIPSEPESAPGVLSRLRSGLGSHLDWRWLGAAVMGIVAVIVVIVAVGGGSSGAGDDGGVPTGGVPTGGVQQSTAAQPAPIVTVLAPEEESRVDVARLQAALAPLEDQGVSVVVSSELDELVAAANPRPVPDISIDTLTEAVRLVEEHSAQPLPESVLRSLEANFQPAWIESVSVEGRVYGVPVAVRRVNSFVWYSPQHFEGEDLNVPRSLDDLEPLLIHMRELGLTPWCLGLEDGDSTGWPIKVWLEAAMLRLHGEHVYSQWLEHEIPFDHEMVREAASFVERTLFETGDVFGGRAATASTYLWDAGLGVAEGHCMMHLQYHGYGSVYEDSGYSVGPGMEIEAILLPSYDGAQMVVVDAVYAVALNQDDAVVEVLHQLTEPAFADELIGPRGYLSPNRNQEYDRYDHTFDSFAAQVVANADVVEGLRSEIMPPEPYGVLLSAGTEWISGQIGIDEFLSRVEEAWVEP